MSGQDHCAAFNVPTVEDLLKVRATDGAPVIIRDADLTTWAAYEAAQVLAHNWAAALASGEPLADLAADVETVSALLTQWRVAVSKHYGCLAKSGAAKEKAL